jgi:hypothetical protein
MINANGLVCLGKSSPETMGFYMFLIKDGNLWGFP